MNRLLTLLFLFSSFGSFSQDCGCAKYTENEQKKFQDLVDEQEFVKARKMAMGYTRMKNSHCQLVGLDQQSVIYARQFYSDSLKIILDQENTLLNKNPCNKNARMEYYMSLAEYYHMENNIQRGTDCYFKALKLAVASKNYDRQAFIYSSLIVSFGELGHYKKKLEYAQKLYAIIHRVESVEAKVDIMNLVAVTYRSNYYRLHSSQGVDSIQILAKKMLRISKDHGYERGKFNAFTLLSDYAAIKKKYDLSLSYLDSANHLIAHSNTLVGPQFPYKIYFNKSFVYYEQKKYKEAAIASDSLLHYSKMSNQYQILAVAYEKCYEAQKALGRTDLALKYHELFRLYQDSVANESNLTIIEGLEQKYQKEQNLRKIESEKQKNKLLKKENAISSLNNKLLLFGIFATLLVIVVIVLIFRQRNLKNQNTLIEVENRLNRSRMNPHFFFNALTSLQGVALDENGGKKVAIRLAKFSGLIRKILENTYSNFITLEEEVEFLKEYLEVSNLRNDDFFEYHFLIDEALIHDEFIVPSMLLQPFAENAIQHAFMKMKTGGILEIEIKSDDKYLLVYIRDNGPGLESQRTLQGHTSRAIEITKERLGLLQRKLKGEYTVSISNRKNTSGVEVFIKLPLLLKHEHTDH